MYERRRGSTVWAELGGGLVRAELVGHLPGLMPRVVEEQQSAFASSAFFTNLARTNDVRYTSIPHAPEAERQERFLFELREGRLPITVVETGLNLELHVLPALLEPPQPSSTASTAILAQDGPQVRISSRLILNGVCVRWKGWMDRQSLKGQGRLEFDPVTAEVEAGRLRSEMDVLAALQLERLFPPPPPPPSVSQADGGGGSSAE